MKQVYLSFHISEELFGIHVLQVLEVLQKQVIAEVPNSPKHIVGIINFRGDVVPVFDTRIRLNMAPRNENSSFVIAVLDLVHNDEPFRVGAIVDRVRDVLTINDEDIKPVPNMGSKFNTDLLSGVVRYNEKFILLIDVNKVFIENKINSDEPIPKG